MSRTSVLLPLPLTPVTETRQPSGIFTSRSRRLCSRAPLTVSHSPFGERRSFGHRDRSLAGQVLPGDRVLDLEDPLHGTAVDDCAAELAGAGTDVDDPVALADRLLVVLDDEHRVAEVTQADERVDQPAVVALVQTDRRLVEHVQRADEPGADLRRQPDPLRLAAGERARRARQREVVEADVEEEPEAGVDLLRHPLGDHLVPLGQLEAGEELRRLADAHVAHRGDVEVVDGDRERRRLEPRALARVAGDEAHVALVLLAAPLAVGALVAALDPRDHALVGGRVLAGPAVAVLVLDLQVAGRAVQDDLLLLRVERPVRRVEVDREVGGDRLQHPREVLRVRAAPRRDGAAVDAHVRVGDDELGVDLVLRAEAVARLARAVGRVEREVARRELLVALPARRADEVLAERQRLGLLGAVRGTSSTSATPSASFSAVSSESVRRRSMPSRRTSRSTTTSIVCCS